MNEALASLFARDGAATGSGPLYLALRRSIERAIGEGVLKPGDALPSERDLAATADVSRVTVRKAVQDLVAGGMLVQRHGSGTFVSAGVAHVEQSLSVLTSFTEDMARRGLTAQSVWLDRGVYTPSPAEMVVLGLTSEDSVARLGRLRIANGTPLAIERAALSARFLPEPQTVEHSLYETLAERGNRPVRAIQRLSAALLDEDDAQLLGVPAGSPSLNIERTSYLASGRVIEFTRSRYRADAYDFVAELRLRDG